MDNKTISVKLHKIWHTIDRLTHLTKDISTACALLTNNAFNYFKNSNIVFWLNEQNSKIKN